MTRAGVTWELTLSGEDALLEVDGPLTKSEQNEWIEFGGGKTKISKAGVPLRILRIVGWRPFSVPHARALIERWRKYGVRRPDDY